MIRPGRIPFVTEIARGLAGVVVTETRLSRVDGEAGRLLLGGFPVEELAPRASFEEVVFLLWNGRLPSARELRALEAALGARRPLPAGTLEVLRAAARSGLAPMEALRAATATLDLGDPELGRGELQNEPAAANQARALALVGALPSLAAAYLRLLWGLEPIAPDSGLGHAASYLWMLSGTPPDPERVRALETYLNATVDHGMNASTFAARVIASTRSDMVSAVVGALGALKGPLHGGAPGPALEMIFALRERARREGQPLEALADAWVRSAVNRGERIMGFGHRVYRVRDPRADVLATALERLFPKAGQCPLYDDARVVETVVLRELARLKPHRPLATNVEFYTALLLHALDLPPAVFTPTFAVARVAGWTAHVLEQIREDRLIRPRAAYVGPTGASWVPVEHRGEPEPRTARMS
jgi:citrate synthase